MANIDLQAFRDREEQGYITCRPHPEHDLVIWNYTAKCQYERAWDEVTLQARGLITRSDGEIVGRAFPKFFNIEEHQTALPLEPFTVTTKMDGSLGVLFFIKNMPYIATRGSFTSEQSVRANQILQRYQDFAFPPGYTYLFEIVYPQNRIVVDYGSMEDLILLAALHTETGAEMDIHSATWPFPVVKRYDGIKDIEQLRLLEEANAEGFVIRFTSGLRVKLKFREYVRLHKLMTHVNARAIWERLMANQSLDDLLNEVPDEFYQWVRNVTADLQAQFVAIEAQCREVYTQVVNLPTRKEQAEIVKTFRYGPTVFKMLDNKNYAETIWKHLRPEAERPFREDDEG